MSIDSKIQHCLIEGSCKTTDLVKFIDDFCKTTTKRTIVVLDNAPIHRSKLFKSKIRYWQKQDLSVLFLSPYSPELNKIEILWRFIKYKWLPFDAFLNSQNLKDRLNDVILNIGNKYVINFY